MILWLERVLGVCFEESAAPRVFRDMCMVPCYKGKGDKCECNSYKRTVDAVRNFLNPFNPRGLQENDKLYNLSSGARVPQDIEIDLLRAEEAGAKARKDFVKERLEESDKFFDPVTRLNLKTMAHTKKKTKVTSTRNKLVQYKQQGNSFVKILVKSPQQDPPMKLDLEG